MSLLVGKRGRGGEKSDHHPDHEGAADSQAGRYQDNSPANQLQRTNLTPTNQHTSWQSLPQIGISQQISILKGLGREIEVNIRTKITAYRSK
jgi:hypothetical protein